MDYNHPCYRKAGWIYCMVMVVGILAAMDQLCPVHYIASNPRNRGIDRPMITHEQENECTEAALRYVWMKKKEAEESKNEPMKDKPKPTEE